MGPVVELTVIVVVSVGTGVASALNGASVGESVRDAVGKDVVRIPEGEGVSGINLVGDMVGGGVVETGLLST